MKEFKDEIIEVIKKATGLSEVNLEVPPDHTMGDFAFPCFSLARERKKNPKEIAEDLCKEIPVGGAIRKVEVSGPYVNIFLDYVTIAEEILKKVRKEAENYGRVSGSTAKVIVETPSPNTNKPLHLGHLRNILLGLSISNVLRLTGREVHIVEAVNDRGVHICKSMLAYKRWGGGETPESVGKKSDHFVGDYYVMFSREAKKDPSLEQEAQDMLLKWEQGDPETVELWKQMNSWVLEGFRQTYERLGFAVEKQYFESETYKHGKDIVENNMQVFQKDEDGALIADLEDKGLGKKVVLRPNGTSVYITQDLYLAKKRQEDYDFDEMIYVVANEQKYHFEVLFELFRRLGFSFAGKCYHFAYGMVNLPDGKMKSREGTVVDIDDILDEVFNLTKSEIEARYADLDQVEKDHRAREIANAAVRFFFLKFDPLKDFAYNPKESISFEGETGPYVQYTHARICSILRKSDGIPVEINYKVYEEEESRLIIRMIAEFPDIIEESSRKLNPSLVTRYLLDLSQLCNEYYHKYPVLKAEDVIRDARLMLLDRSRQVISNGLEILGIKALERM